MLQNVIGKHEFDENGMPAGGVTTGVGISISWQNGPLGRGPDRGGAGSSGMVSGDEVQVP